MSYSIFLFRFVKVVSWIFPAKSAETDPPVSIMESMPVMAVVAFSKEAYVGTVHTLAELRTVKETAPWIKSIETSAAPAD